MKWFLLVVSLLLPAGAYAQADNSANGRDGGHRPENNNDGGNRPNGGGRY